MIGILHNDIEKARKGLIDLLIKYKSLKEHNVTVVFDAYKGGNKCEQTSLCGGVKIIYTRLGESADDVIKRIISYERRELAIITSDRELIKHAWSMNCIPVPSNVFSDILERRLLKNHIEPGVKDIESAKPSKGSSHRLSRKDKALKRVLGKL